MSSKVFKFKNKIVIKKKLKKKVKTNQNGKKNYNSNQHESLLSESNDNSKNNLDDNDENDLDEDDEVETNEEYDEKNEQETNLSQTNEQIANTDENFGLEEDEDDEHKHDEFNRNLAQTRRSSYSISSNKIENSNSRRVSYSNIPATNMTPLILSSFSSKNPTTTSSSSSSSSSLSPNTANKLNALSNLPGLANLIQQQQSSDFLSSLFPINGASDAAKKSSQIQLNTIASTLMHHLNAAVLFNQYNNTNSNQSNSIVDCLPNTGTIPFTSNTNNFTVNSNTNLNAALDLTIKNEPNIHTNKKKSITECSDEYTSSLSPVSTSSTISSSSLKNSQSFTSIKSKNFHQDKRIKDTSMMSHRKSGNKAISDVINRLNLNLPNSYDHEHEDENHHSGKRFNFKKLCTKNMKETQCDNIEEDATKQVGQHRGEGGGEQEEEDEEEEGDEEDEEINGHKESQHKLNEIHQPNQSESSGYKCTHCNIIFTEYPLYSIHAGMHSCKNPWQCSVCGHTCANKIDFNVHILHLSKI